MLKYNGRIQGQDPEKMVARGRFTHMVVGGSVVSVSDRSVYASGNGNMTIPVEESIETRKPRRKEQLLAAAS